MGRERVYGTFDPQEEADELRSPEETSRVRREGGREE